MSGAGASDGSAGRAPGAGRPTTLLFDWDNTLVDTWTIIHHALAVTFEAMGARPWTLEETRQNVRQSAREAFPALFGERSDEATGIFYATFERDHLDQLKPLPGAAEMLAGLAAAGYDLAVVSNKQGPYLRREAAHLGWDGYFRALVGANDAARDKPAPEVVELALAGGPGAQAPREAIWFVGDTDIDLRCAVDSGCVPVLLRTTPPQPDEFADALPRLHIERCSDLLRLLHPV